MTVLLPFDLPDAPADLTYLVSERPETLGDADLAGVEFFVPPYTFDRSTLEAMARMPRLRVVQTQTAGTEHLQPLLPEGVILCNGRGIHDAATAELAVTLTLAALNGLSDFGDAQRHSQWRPEWRAGLADRRVVVVGAGAIGAAIRRRLEPFECEIAMVGRTARDVVHASAELPDLLPEADVVILIVPATPETRGLFDAAMLARLKQGALLVNVARGAVVDTDALTQALVEGRIRAALDVTDPEPLPAGHPLWRAPGLLLTPHVGGMAETFHRRTRAVVRRQLERYAAGEELANRV